jgi:hypothetical protein
MIYLTSWDACPVGCGMGMLFLKARGSGNLFLYCPACEIGIDRPPGDEDSEKKRIALGVPDALAPAGIALPTRKEIEAVGWEHRIATEAPESEYDGSLWRLWAITHIESREYKRAIDLLDQVIATWHVPPPSAYTLRDEALRLQMSGGKGTEAGS